MLCTNDIHSNELHCLPDSYENETGTKKLDCL
jgi:hypothetical protein